jgi:hypothetical protein
MKMNMKTVLGKEFAFHHKMSNFLTEIAFLWTEKKNKRNIKRKIPKEAERRQKKRGREAAINAMLADGRGG